LLVSFPPQKFAQPPYRIIGGGKLEGTSVCHDTLTKFH